MQKLLQETIRFFEQWLEMTSVGVEHLRPSIDALKKLGEPVDRETFIPPLVKQWLEPCLQMPTASHCEPLMMVLREVAWQMKWIPSPANYISPDFAKGFAYAQLVGHPHRAVESAVYLSDEVAVGLSIQAPRLFYPPHHHPAIEFYMPLAGTAVWQLGTDKPQPQSPGAAIFHDTMVSHGMQTQDEPMLTIWAWTGELNSPPVVTKREWL
ncbi:MAG: dimethylsulfonioproprionate lyase family protein [Chloroflexota bacterium]